MKSMRPKFALIVFMLMVSASALGQDAKGWFQQFCDGASFHLEKFDGDASQQELTLWFWSKFKVEAYAGEGWFDVQLCPTEKTCDVTAKAKMEFLEHRKNKVAGRYVVDVGGKHLEGGVVLKERHRKHPVHICM
jgi:hypothetical protein